MFKSGKKIALSNLPARYVFKILQEAKKTPIIEQEIKFLGTILFSPLLSIRKNKSETTKQKVNAKKTNVFVCIAYDDFC